MTGESWAWEFWINYIAFEMVEDKSEVLRYGITALQNESLEIAEAGRQVVKYDFHFMTAETMNLWSNWYASASISSHGEAKDTFFP